MKRTLVACGLLRPDLERLLEKSVAKPDVVWMEAALHDRPSTLNARLQSTIDALEGVDEISLAYSLCGNALLGLTATVADVVYVKTDDCISVMMHKFENLPQMRKHSLFTNACWLASSPENAESARILKKYGIERGERLIGRLYENYDSLIYMQTEPVISRV